MTKIFKITAIAASAAVATISCHKQEIEHPALEPVVLKFISEGEQPESKTFWDGSTISWSEGDKIGIAYTLSGQWAESFYESTPLAAAGEVALFTAPVEMPTVTSETVRFHAIYPSSVHTGNISSKGIVQVDIPAVQTPSATSFDASADLMVSRSVDTYKSIPNSAIPLLWNRLVAHADFMLTMPEIPSGEILQSVVISAAQDMKLVGSYMLDLENRTLTAKDSEASSNVITLLTDNAQITDGKMRLWAAFLPCHLTSLSVEINTDKATYTRQIPSCDLTFKANVRGVLSIDMTSASRRGKTDPVKNALINERLFKVIDLNRSGLETVKSLYEDGCLYEAAEALKAYYSSRTDVVVPLVDFSISKYTTTQKSIADQALKENGYRFYIANGYEESTSSSGNVYYSFLDNDGGVNWNFTPTTESMFKQHLHRHPWVDTQALVYWVDKDDRYVESLAEVYMDWLESNPCPVAGTDSYYMGMEHSSYRIWCNLQACARIDVYIKVIQYCISSPAFTPEFLSHLLVSLYDCVECIRANYYYADTGNIRLSESNAVLNMAVMMPEFAKASEWLDESAADIARLQKQLLMEDGVLEEKDPSYHIGVIATFYEIHKVLSTNGKESTLPDDYFSRLKGGVNFVRDIMYPNYSIEDFNDTRSSSWTKSVLKKNFVKYVEMFPEDETLRWFATERTSGSAPTELLSLYKPSGWYMFRTGWMPSDMMLILKNNENTFGYAHCQNDNGTIGLYNNGRNFLPDSGVYTYGGSAEDNAAREAFRATKMHNTLTYKGGNSVNNSADNSGIFKNSVQNNNYDMVHVSNQSYGALCHERAVFRVKDGFFVIVDFGIGSATGDVQLNWHLCPGDVTYHNHSSSYECRTTFSDGNNMSFRTFCFNGTTLNSNFTAHTGTSYTSDLPGRKYERSCYDITVSKSSTSTPVRFITVIYPFAEASKLPAINAMFNSASKITVTVGDDEYLLSL